MTTRQAMTSEFSRLLKPGMRGLDLGAGSGIVAASFAQSGLRTVLGVDRMPDPRLPGVQWIQADLRNGLRTVLGDQDPFDFIVCWDLIQFLSRNYVLEEFLPSLSHYTKPGCLLSVCTFWSNPNPPLGIFIPSYFLARDLEYVFRFWEILTSEEVEIEEPGLDGDNRTWRVTNILARFR